MAQDHVEVPSINGSLTNATSTTTARQTYRSFKKKYVKLKIKFDLALRDSEALIREELRIQDLSKRIQEQNDQLLEVLLEFNDSLHLPSPLRYDLSIPGDPASHSPRRGDSQSSYYDVATAKAALSEAKAELASGRRISESYRRLEDAVKRSKEFEPGLKYSSLLSLPHIAPAPFGHPPSPSGNLESTLGYLTPEHETEFYLAMDARLGDDAAVLQLSRAPEKPSRAEREREATLRTPISVYSWLRRNQPSVFLQENEIASEKSISRPTNLRSSKRTSAQARKEEDAFEEDNIMNDIGPAPPIPKGKRKREEDTQYRPKGGSSRAGRKKKEDGPPNARRSKRSSGVGS